MKVYLAAPFFNETQLNRVGALETILRPIVDLYSPRQDGIILKDLPAAERAAACQGVFNTNVERINWCTHVLACIDDRDTGTVWEMGYAFAKGKRIVSFTTMDHGLNVMLQCCVVAHLRLYTDVAYLFSNGVTDEVCSRFKDFNPHTT